MNRIAIIRPYEMTKSICDLKEHWLKAFLLSNIENFDLKNNTSCIEIHKYQYNGADSCGEFETEIINGTLVSASSHACYGRDLITISSSNHYLKIGEETALLFDELRAKTLYNVGLAVFKNDHADLWQYSAVVAIQEAHNLAEIILEVIPFSGEYKNQSPLDTQKRLIKSFALNNTNFIPLSLMLSLIYPEQPDLNETEKINLVFDVLLKENLGLDTRYVYNRFPVAIGMQYESKLLDKGIYQKVLAKVHYSIFGNQITFTFDISEAPEKPENLSFKNVEISIKKLYENAIDVDADYLKSCADSAFKQVLKTYTLDDQYYKNL